MPSMRHHTEVESSEPVTMVDEIERQRASLVLERAFVAAQLGMPSEDHETALDLLRIQLGALLVDHLAPDERTIEYRGSHRASIEDHWQRMVTTAVTHTFLLGGGFVQPEPLLAAVVDHLERTSAGGEGTRRPPLDHGRLVLGVLEDLAVFEATARAGRMAGPADMAALVDLIALAAIGAVRGDPPAGAPASPAARGRGRWSRSTAMVAASFGIPDASLVEATKEGWVCDACGCFFAGTVEGSVAHPDRFAPIGRRGPCDGSTECACHAAPVRREIR